MPARNNVPRLSKITVSFLGENIYQRFLIGSQDDLGEKVRNCLNLHLEPGLHHEVDMVVWQKLSNLYDGTPHSRKIIVNVPNEEGYLDQTETHSLDFNSRTTLSTVGKTDIRLFLPKLLGTQTKHLDFTSCKMLADNSKKEKPIMKTVYETLDSRCPNIEKLVMGQSFIFQPELISNLNEKLPKLSRLVSLKLLYIGVDNMVTNLAEHCPKLRELSLKGSSKIGDSSADEISKCRNLGVLDIQGTKISGRGCLKIIENCKCLEWIEHCPFNCDSESIFRSRKEMFDLIKNGFINSENIVNNTNNIEGAQREEIDEENTIEPFTIKNFWLFNPKSEELQVSTFCPRLEKIRLDFVFQDMNFNLNVSSLASYNNLRILDLNFYDNHNNSLLNNILSICGQKLEKLVFNVCADYRSVVDCHNIIGQHCPMLTSLTFIGDYENAAHLDQETDAVLIRRNQDWHPHPLLESLHLGGYCTDGRLSWLLSGCHHIRNIHLDGNLERLSDSAWFAILTENSLHHLKSLWFNTSTNMSMDSVR